MNSNLLPTTFLPYRHNNEQCHINMSKWIIYLWFYNGAWWGWGWKWKLKVHRCLLWSRAKCPYGRQLRSFLNGILFLDFSMKYFLFVILLLENWFVGESMTPSVFMFSVNLVFYVKGSWLVLQYNVISFCFDSSFLYNNSEVLNTTLPLHCIEQILYTLYKSHNKL